MKKREMFILSALLLFHSKNTQKIQVESRKLGWGLREYRLLMK